MLLKKEKYKVCNCCGQAQELISSAVYGCDNCKNDISDGEKLSVTSHFKGTKKRHKQFDFCSWKCCIEKLPTIKTNYFISMPFLSFDEKKPGLRAKDFFDLVNPT